LINHDQFLRIVYLLAWMSFIAGGSYAALRRVNARRLTKYALLWLAIMAGLLLFYYAMLRF
jgi:hypothetical protein